MHFSRHLKQRKIHCSFTYEPKSNYILYDVFGVCAIHWCYVHLSVLWSLFMCICAPREWIWRTQLSTNTIITHTYCNKVIYHLNVHSVVKIQLASHIDAVLCMCLCGCDPNFYDRTFIHRPPNPFMGTQQCSWYCFYGLVWWCYMKYPQKHNHNGRNERLKIAENWIKIICYCADDLLCWSVELLGSK